MANRIEKWDVLKGSLIYLVVLGHICCFYRDDSSNIRALFIFIYLFHMPLFIFISGLFSKNTINEKRYNKVFSLLIAYFFAKLIFWIPSAIEYENFQISIFSEAGPPWFVLALFIFNLLTIWLKRFSKWWVIGFSIMFACIAGYDDSIGNTLVLSRIIVFYPFFFIGYCVNPEGLNERLSKPLIKMVSLVLLVIVVMITVAYIDKLYFLWVLLFGNHPFSSLADVGAENLINYGGLLRLLYYPIVFVICIAVISITPNCFKILSWYGKRTLPIYMFHYSLIEGWSNYWGMKEFVYAMGMSNYHIIILAFIIMNICSISILGKIVNKVIYPKILEE